MSMFSIHYLIHSSQGYWTGDGWVEFKYPEWDDIIKFYSRKSAERIIEVFNLTRSKVVEDE